jgi:hypothetical protein
MNKTNGAASKVTFGKFTKFAIGEDCEGADVLRDGASIGTMSRIVRWDFKHASSRALVVQVLGYEVEIGAERREFLASKTVELTDALAAAKAFAKEMAATKA